MSANNDHGAGTPDAALSAGRPAPSRSAGDGTAGFHHPPSDHEGARAVRRAARNPSAHRDDRRSGEHGHESYVALRVVGSIPDHLAFTILDLVPGCALELWMPEFELPDRPLRPGEFAYSNIMNPIEAAKLLDAG